MVKQTLNKFGDEFFYTVGLNLKFCHGIRQYRQDLSLPEITSNDSSLIIFNLFDNWESTNCSAEGYEELVRGLEKLGIDENDSIGKIFVILWSKIQVLADMHQKFDTEVLILTGATIRKLLSQSATMGIENFQTLESSCIKVWY